MIEIERAFFGLIGPSSEKISCGRLLSTFGGLKCKHGMDHFYRYLTGLRRDVVGDEPGWRWALDERRGVGDYRRVGSWPARLVDTARGNEILFADLGVELGLTNRDEIALVRAADRSPEELKAKLVALAKRVRGGVVISSLRSNNERPSRVALAKRPGTPHPYSVHVFVVGSKPRPGIYRADPAEAVEIYLALCCMEEISPIGRVRSTHTP